MARVGLIANPAAGKDIRRLVAHASVFDNNEKVNIVRRVLLGLEAAGVAEVLLMPDSYGIGTRALQRLALAMRCTFLDLEPEFTQQDTTRAAEHLRALGVGCIVTLGGDGTNRAVATGCGPVPLVPISTGTNNVFPQMIEGTVAGLAAGVVAAGVSDPDVTVRPYPRLEILRDGCVAAIALVDVVVASDRFVGAGALWDLATIRQIILTHADPGHIGFSSVGGNLGLPQLDAQHGLVLEIGGETQRVLAPIAPGVLRELAVAAVRPFAVGEQVAIAAAPAVLALDGERAIVLRAGETVQVRLSAAGPHVVDVRAALRQAAARGFFVRRGGEAGAGH